MNTDKNLYFFTKQEVYQSLPIPPKSTIKKWNHILNLIDKGFYPAQILRKMSSLKKSTLYKNLKKMEKKGIIRRSYKSSHIEYYITEKGYNSTFFGRVSKFQKNKNEPYIRGHNAIIQYKLDEPFELNSRGRGFNGNLKFIDRQIKSFGSSKLISYRLFKDKVLVYAGDDHEDSDASKVYAKMWFTATLTITAIAQKHNLKINFFKPELVRKPEFEINNPPEPYKNIAKNFELRNESYQVNNSYGEGIEFHDPLDANAFMNLPKKLDKLNEKLNSVQNIQTTQKDQILALSIMKLEERIANIENKLK